MEDLLKGLFLKCHYCLTTGIIICKNFWSSSVKCLFLFMAKSPVFEKPELNDMQKEFLE